jgi:S-DNA-T family DNA segregation ATPase FtsK/SpoIIIE
MFDREAAPLRKAAAQKLNTDDYLKLDKARAAKVHRRGLAVLATSAGLVVLVFVWLVARRWGVPAGEPARDLVPWWIEWPLWAVLVGVLGKVGTPADKRVMDVAMVNAAAPPRLTAEVVTRALRSLGISAMNAKGAEITYPAPITRDGPGWRADADLPFGVTPQDVMEKRRELASGLRRPLGCVWPEPARDDHAGRLILWVGDRDLAKTKQERWPLAQRGTTDLFTPVPFGTDQRGRAVTVTLMFASMVVGSIPRMGKTFAVRLLLLAAALDVRAELHLFELKGTGDFGPLEPVAHAYRAGDEEEDIEYAVADMRALHAEMRRRTKVIRELPRAVCPESKVTGELADKRSLGLWPIVVTADECQRWFEHKRHGEELTAIAEDLVRRGPAAGIIPIFATQRPDAKSLPTGISGNAILRFCLKVMGHTENDMVLGTSAHKNGIRATIFSRKDLGIGYLSGEGDDPQITRTFYVDSPTAEAIVARARAAREAAGTLSGHAPGEPLEVPLTPAASLLGDLRVVFATIEQDWSWSEALVGRLAGMKPELYAGWDADTLARTLSGLGVATRQLNRTGPDGRRANRRGVIAADLPVALPPATRSTADSG